MAMTAEKRAYFREYNSKNKSAKSAAYKRWHEANGTKRYHENLELSRAIKRKYYRNLKGDLAGVAKEQELIDKLRAQTPRKPGGTKPIYTPEERVIARRGVVRKARYKNIKGVDSFIERTTCEICHQSGKKMCLDHCHETNVFRGWICDDCNIALGRVREDVKVLQAMIDYISKRRVRGVA